MAAIFPQGRAPVGDTAAVEAILARWHAQRPTVPAENPYTLERMLSSTLAVYKELVENQD